MPFSVVHFLETDEVAAITKSWILDKNHCKLPPTKNANVIKRAILEHRSPKSDWETHEIVILGCYDNYATAKKRVELALDTSNLDLEASDTEEKKSKKRKRQKDNYAEIVSDSSDDDYHQKKNDKILDVSVLSAESLQPINVQVISTPSSNEATSAISTLDLVVAENEPTSLQQHILKTLLEIQSTLNSHSAILKQVLPSTEASMEMPSFMPKIPVESALEMKEWEEFLNEPGRFSRCVKYFGCRTSSDASSSTRRMLSEIITNQFAKEYNWNGRPPKTPFKILKTVSLILCTIKENPMTRNVPASVVEDTIKDWLKHASFRESYKQKKKCKTELM